MNKLKKWNHNINYHNFILNNLPEGKTAALDIGSGDGFFASRLSVFFKKVVCLEPDKTSLEYSLNRYSSNPVMDLKDVPFNDYIGDIKFDLITSIASIHHMDLEESLKKMNKLLNRDGKIVVLGLYKESSFIDFFLSAIACAPNIFLTKIWYRNRDKDFDMKTTPAKMTIKEIKYVASKVLGTYKFKRHFFWRYSLIYTNKC